MDTYLLNKNEQELALEVLGASIYSLFPKVRIFQKKFSEFGFSLEVLLDHDLDDLSIEHIKKRYNECLDSDQIKISQMMKENAREFFKHEKLFDLASEVSKLDNLLVSVFAFAGYYSVVSEDLESLKLESISSLSLDQVKRIGKENFKNKSKYRFEIKAKAFNSNQNLQEFEKQYKKRLQFFHMTKAIQGGLLELSLDNLPFWTTRGLDFKRALKEKVESLTQKAGYRWPCFKHTSLKKNINFFNSLSSTKVYKFSFWQELERKSYNFEDGLFNMPFAMDNVGLVFLQDRRSFEEEIRASLELMLGSIMLFTSNFYVEFSFSKKIGSKEIKVVNQFFNEHKISCIKNDAKLKGSDFLITIYSFDIFGRLWRVFSLDYIKDQNVFCHIIHNIDRLCGLSLENLNSDDLIFETMNKKLKNNTSKIPVSVNL